jgi:PAS domain S-box-containing protein
MNRLSLRLLFVIGALSAACGALVYAASSSPLAPAQRWSVVQACALLALLLGLAAWKAPVLNLRWSVGVAGAAVLLVLGLMAVWLDEGIHTPGLAYVGLLLCGVAAIGGQRLAWCMAAAAGLLALGLYAGEVAGLIPVATGDPHLSGPLPRLLMVAAWMAAGLGAGTVLHHALNHALLDARRREQRFRAMLRIAVDWYWEQDDQYRYTYVSEKTGQGSLLSLAHRLGVAPWDIVEFGLASEQLEAHRAHLKARKPFQHLIAKRRDESGQVHFVSLSGEPRFDEKRAFQGYWGIGRDVTSEISAQMAVAASEARYRELFARSPTPLVLHRRGLVLEANEAAALMFGFDSPQAMLGFNLLDIDEEGDTVVDIGHGAEVRGRSPKVLERIVGLDAGAPGASLPVTDFRMRSIKGRRISAQATGSRVETPQGAATLSLYFDITARRAAEAALRRSEAVLRLLFATSPDAIILTEMASARVTLVNDTFTRLTGFAASDVVGLRGSELPIWQDPAAYERLAQELKAHGKVGDFAMQASTQSGGTLSLLLSAAHFQADGADYSVINARDVTHTERVRLQHDAMLRSASIGIALTLNRQIVQTNPCFERMFGWPQGALTGQRGAVIWLNEEDYEEVGRIAGPRLARGINVDMVRQVRRRDGSLFWCRMMGQAIDLNDPSKGGTIWTAEDVTERQHMTRALAAARDAAEAASRAKTAFLANTSHEVRTPLHGLLGLARLAQQPGLDDAKRQRYLEQIVDSAEGLSSIITDVLDLSKIEAGKLSLETVAFSLYDELAHIQRSYEPLADAKGLRFELQIDAAVPTTVAGDPVRVRQIVSNYVTNALKFTSEGWVQLHARMTADGLVQIAVTDTGPGIDEATQQRLFSPFTQADESTTRRYGGTGLGLSICRELAALMGGSVGLSSRPGEGSCFWAELALPEAHGAPPVVDISLDDNETLQGARVLLVEDNPVNMMIGVAMLEQWGLHVMQAEDGHLAVQAVERAFAEGAGPEVVLMDVQMPSMSGHEAARQLRSRYSPEELPIIALTAAALTSERDAALEAGMNDFLTKPIDSLRLQQTLMRVLKAHPRHGAVAPAAAPPEPGETGEGPSTA